MSPVAASYTSVGLAGRTSSCCTWNAPVFNSFVSLRKLEGTQIKTMTAINETSAALFFKGFPPWVDSARRFDRLRAVQPGPALPEVWCDGYSESNVTERTLLNAPLASEAWKSRR